MTRTAAVRRSPWPVLAVISLGGTLGALGRYAVGQAYPVAPVGFPWATFVVNVSGCLLIGVLMVLVADVWAGRRLVRLFLGVGVLGGYTTFSTYAVDIDRLTRAGSVGTAVVYLAATVIGALVAVYAGGVATRTAIARWARRRVTKEA